MDTYWCNKKIIFFERPKRSSLSSGTSETTCAALTSLPSSTVMREKNMTQVLGVTTEKEKRVVEKRADEVSSEASAGAEQKRTN